MTAYEIYRELDKVGGWSQEPRRVKWLAARYYSGADTVDDLRAQAEPKPVCGDRELPPVLTHEQVSTIIMLR